MITKVRSMAGHKLFRDIEASDDVVEKEKSGNGIII